MFEVTKDTRCKSKSIIEVLRLEDPNYKISIYYTDRSEEQKKAGTVGPHQIMLSCKPKNGALRIVHNGASGLAVQLPSCGELLPEELEDHHRKLFIAQEAIKELQQYV